MDIIGDLSRIRTLLSENVNNNSDDNEILMDLLTFLIPDHSIWDDGVFRDPKTLDLRKVYMEYSVNKKNTELKKNKNYQIALENKKKNEEKEEDWTYLNGKIKWEKSKGKYAQFPRECELNVQMDLLEKERPVVGGNQFGDFVRNLDNEGNYSVESDDTSLFSRNLIESSYSVVGSS